MAFEPVTAALIGGSTLFNIASTIAGNNVIEEQADAEIMAARIRASQQRDENARISRKNVGQIESNAADRNVFGRSSRAVALDQIVAGARNEQSINTDMDFRILSIASRAEASKTSPIAAGLSGAAQGLTLASGLDGLGGLFSSGSTASARSALRSVGIISPPLGPPV